MNTRSVFFGAIFPIIVVAGISYARVPDQPYMQAAVSDLQQAKSELRVAEHNKGGHRVKAVEYVNLAIAEVNRGIAYDRRHNHAQSTADESFSSFVTLPDQPHMQAALDHLKDAKRNLESAEADKGGHRVKALDYVNWAIDEVNQGIAAGA